MRDTIVLWLCLLMLIALYLQGHNTDYKGAAHITTSQGIDCILFQGTGVSCNWEKYNSDTKQGEYPYAEE